MKFNQRDFIYLYGHMWVNVQTCEKMIVLGDDAYSLDGFVGKKVFLPQSKVDELCEIEDRVNNYLEY